MRERKKKKERIDIVCYCKLSRPFFHGLENVKITLLNSFISFCLSRLSFVHFLRFILFFFFKLDLFLRVYAFYFFWLLLFLSLCVLCYVGFECFLTHSIDPLF